MSKEPLIDESMVIPACKQALESAANRAWSRRKLSPGLATAGAMDSDNPFRDLSDGAVRRIEKALRDLPGLMDSDKSGDKHCLSAARHVMASRKIKPID